MLKYLHIENIAVIEKTDIDFSCGFNVLTGETGAGKSIVIDSINAVLGERASKDLIRNGFESAEVSAVFGMLSDGALCVLRENGFEPDEDGNVIVRRVLSLSGKGSIKINGCPTTAAILKEISGCLVNIHGQHDSQGLLNPDLHYTYIDLLAENDKILSDYYKEFHHLNEVRKELSGLETDDDKKQREIELLSFQIKEIEDADIKPNEIEKLKENAAAAKNQKKIIAALNNSYGFLNDSDEKDGVLSLLMNAQKSLSGFENKKFSEIGEKLNAALMQIDEICGDIRQYQNDDYFLNLDYDKIVERLEFLNTLMLKYGNSEEKIFKYLSDSREKLDNIKFADERIEFLSNELDASTQRLIKLGDALSASRMKAAKLFSKSVTDALHSLYMPNASLEVKIEKGRYTKHGCDNVEFLICTNVGEEYKSLHKIASGGELSRIMLAIKSVLSDKDNVDTLIFDEIDTGISGRAAGAVGLKIKELSRVRQIICVTHLAQIAAFADNHLLIEKGVKDNRTFTHIKPLRDDERIAEIARIMSGTDMTDNLFNSAKELLDRSSK